MIKYTSTPGKFQVPLTAGQTPRGGVGSDPAKKSRGLSVFQAGSLCFNVLLCVVQCVRG